MKFIRKLGIISQIRFMGSVAVVSVLVLMAIFLLVNFIKIGSILENQQIEKKNSNYA